MLRTLRDETKRTLAQAGIIPFVNDADGSWDYISTVELNKKYWVLGELSAKAYDAAYTFGGYVDIESILPEHTENTIYIPIEAGEILGKAGVVLGQIIIDDGVDFTVQDYIVETAELNKETVTTVLDQTVIDFTYEVTVNSLIFQNASLLIEDVDYTITDTKQITLTVGAAEGDIITKK